MPSFYSSFLRSNKKQFLVSLDLVKYLNAFLMIHLGPWEHQYCTDTRYVDSSYLCMYLLAEYYSDMLRVFQAFHLWLLKYCKNKNSYDMKIYFHSIKITLYLIKYIFIVSPFFSGYQIYFQSVKINLYSVRNIFIIYYFSFK